ncbi:hypothetical protein D3C78_19280 [compost metagenome]
MKKVLVTHDGAFHADEVFSTAILKHLYPDAIILRSRDPEIWKTADVVYDVGMIFDNEKYFDHHQEHPELRSCGTPYSSFGLIWKKFGEQYIQAFVTNVDIQRIWKKVDRDLVFDVDAIDNGIAIPSSIYGVSQIIGSFNASYKNQNKKFDEAVTIAASILKEKVRTEITAAKAFDDVKTAYENRVNKEILILPQGCNWWDNITTIDVNKEVLFVVSPIEDGRYNINTVSTAHGTYTARKDLPKHWAGLSGDELNCVAGVHDAIFCHKNLFVASARSLSSAIHMAQIAVES